jgi:hypothetical protein
MKKLYFLIFCISLHSCSTKQQKTTDDFRTDKQLKSVVNNEFIKIILNQDTITTQVFKQDVNYIFHCKNGKRIYRKKKFKLLPITDSIGLQKAQLIVDYNKELKSNNLIGLSSKIINVNQKKFLFQEEIGKILIESNSKREGIIVKINYKDSVSIATLKGGYLSTEYTISILNYLKNNMINDLVFNRTQIESHRAITKKYLKNARPNYFYLNPITNQLEVMVNDLIANKEKSNMYPELMNSKPSVDYLDFFKVDSQQILSLISRKTILDKKIFIPKGFKIRLNAGESIDLVQNAAIMSFSPLLVDGTLDNPVSIYSSDSSGEGLHVLQKNKTSIINFLNFDNQTSFLDSSNNQVWKLPSSFTIYEGTVDIAKSNFTNLKSEDAINIFRSKYSFTNSKIDGTFSDAFDADFSFGVIENSMFKNCGNDGVDISGGKLTLKNSQFDLIKDKAISAGEESHLTSEKCTIKNAELAFISKDLSVATSHDNFFSNCQVVYCSFQKKGEYGPAEIIATNDSIKNCSLTHLIEYESSLTIDENKIDSFEYNIIDYLYGKKYGKATIK